MSILQFRLKYLEKNLDDKIVSVEKSISDELVSYKIHFEYFLLIDKKGVPSWEKMSVKDENGFSIDWEKILNDALAFAKRMYIMFLECGDYNVFVESKHQEQSLFEIEESIDLILKSLGNFMAECFNKAQEQTLSKEVTRKWEIVTFIISLIGDCTNANFTKDFIQEKEEKTKEFVSNPFSFHIDNEEILNEISYRLVHDKLVVSKAINFCSDLLNGLSIKDSYEKCKRK